MLVDGILVALAYFLAYRLRFDNGVPSHYQELFEATVGWVVPVALIILAAFGAYVRLWKFISQREYESVVKGVIGTTLVAVGACGISGGIFGVNYATRGGVDQVIPVDVYIPGCPPRPEALLYGILLATGRLVRGGAGFHPAVGS